MPAVFVLDPARIDREAQSGQNESNIGAEVWYGVIKPLARVAERLFLVGIDRDGRQEICVWIDVDNVFYLTFSGQPLAGPTGGPMRRAQFTILRSQ